MTIQVGQTATARISPDGDGVLTGIVYTVTPAGAYSIAQAADGLSAVYTAAVVGTGFVATVVAVNDVGATITDSAPLPDVVAVPNPVTKLNLTITTP